MSSDIIDPQRKIRHLLILEDLDGFRLVPLEESSYFLGRDVTNSIVVRSKGISRQHALFLRVTDADPNSYGFMLIDGNLQGEPSTNGTAVNGEKCMSTKLKHGDQIVFGRQMTAKYLILGALSDSEFENFCQNFNFEEAVTHDINPRETVVHEKGDAPSFGATSLVRLASFPEILPSPMFEINLKGDLTYINPAAYSAFPDLPLLGVQHPTIQGLISLTQSSNQKVLSREVTVAYQVYEQSIHFISENDLIRCCLSDITERKKVEAELFKRDRLLQSVAEATTHLLANISYEEAIDAALDRFGTTAGVDRICISENHVHAATHRLATTLRYEWTGTAIDSVRHFEHRQSQLYSNPHLQRWYTTLAGGTAISGLTRDFPTAEQTVLEQEGVQSVLAVPIIVNNNFWGFIELHDCSDHYQWSDQEEAILRTMAASVSAALERQDKDEIIHQQAFHDALTGLPNRVLFAERLDQALAEAHRNHTHLAVMFMDLDRFKTINDTLGHSVGDELLKEVANRLQSCLRGGDTVARWGGDEFTLLLSTVRNIEDATGTAQRILNAFKEVVEIDHHEIYVNASIGIACFPDDGQNSEGLLQNADVALYQCKEQGRGIFRVYDAGMNSKATELFALQNSLRHALERNELLLYYQPQINLQTGEITGLEALIRWQHPEQGLVSPATFIPLAEESDLIIHIGKWVLEVACKQVVEWQQITGMPLSISVNLSARQFYDPTLVETIAQVLQQTQLDPKYLELEITESITIKNISLAQSVLRQLQGMGIRIAMDDFGTGFSSLNYLTQLPLDILKIDQSFIKRLTADARELEVINAVLALGRGLNLSVIAEGVDTPEQLDLLKSLKCEMVQGFLISPPLPTLEATAKLQTNWLQHQELECDAKQTVPQPTYLLVG
ncbi:EAL domain-containing protein [Acaryochloris sp. IP29b_bin.148]|uniref:EAL domain-containing protein n=1 Tax=Acaryochloris sp. IP29b_bin.148 TaxID=2969218 RepID=UPI00261D1D00|nr:EAL domain-containing protein [Acaryochloris sp. IP29b_bin.148]